MFKLTLELAKQLLEAAEQKARQMKLACDIAIVDEGANLVAFHRMDNARIGDIEVAQSKAWTSAALKMPTEQLAKLAAPGGEAFGINSINQGKITILGGGIPFVVEDRMIGAIGVSGGVSAQDIEVAKSAVQAFENLKLSGSPPPVRARIGSNAADWTFP
ncbi:GlcG/HbpS family heme-binding protein [Paenibacillus physcomitrellae]|uniref:DNA polymerase III subunit delta n=1 Tax=Paenibacillus physcomitrellae TaxID=1619311 RepID=A0ABQ1FSH6_9BACL|nr:heme-binding protein [Paenibacillus physcomitrellae]GGA27773.1 DNA polymerase III subunit delta' [Paenibacillus physcomitrellae]